mgnify:CR=1 FL=1
MHGQQAINEFIKFDEAQNSRSSDTALRIYLAVPYGSTRLTSEVVWIRQ